MKCSDYDKVLKHLLNAKGFVGFSKFEFNEFDYLYNFQVSEETEKLLKFLDIALEKDIKRFTLDYKRGE